MTVFDRAPAVASASWPKPAAIRAMPAARAAVMPCAAWDTIKVIDRDEMTAAIVADYHPVVAAPAVRQVLHRRGPQLPGPRQRHCQAPGHQVRRRAPHDCRT